MYCSTLPFMGVVRRVLACGETQTELRGLAPATLGYAFLYLALGLMYVLAAAASGNRIILRTDLLNRVMGPLVSRAANVLPFSYNAHRLTRDELSLINKYLADFNYREASTPAHLQIAAAHWNRVFTDASSARSARVSSTATSGRNAGSKASTATQSGSRIGVLYDTFYEYLGKHSPELQPIFRSSLHVRSKVLLHISAGMRRILGHEFVLDKVLELTATHLRFGVKLDYFNPLGNALIYAMGVASEGEWNAETEDAWRRMFAHCSVILMAQHKKALERKRVAKNQGKAAHALSPQPQDIFQAHG